MPVIQVEHLQKNYGKHIGTKDVTFSVEKGEIFGFVGPNGAGKSTTIRTLMNLIFPTKGTAFIEGMNCTTHSPQIKEITGYVPSDVRLYGDMNVSELLAFNQSFYANSNQQQETQRLCALFGLDIQKKFRELSTGNKKKVALVCALAPKPSVLILDEPTAGLDPMVQKDLFEELTRQAQKGVTILLSSHNLTEVQEYCHRVAFIRDGQIVSTITLADATSQLEKIVTVVGGGNAPQGLQLISQQGSKRVFKTKADGMPLVQLLAQMQPETFTVQQESIEERFMALYREGQTV